MTTDTTEYYWDEENQIYYYWDEPTQAFYPYQEEEVLPEASQQEEKTVLENTNTVLENTNTVLENTNTVLENTNTVLENKNFVLKDTSDVLSDTKLISQDGNSSLKDPSFSLKNEDSSLSQENMFNEEDEDLKNQPKLDSAEIDEKIGYERGVVRKLTRRFSFAEHGGLAGVLKRVSLGRKSSKQLLIQTLAIIDDDYIKRVKQKEKLKEKLVEAGLLKQDMQSPSSCSSGKASKQESLELQWDKQLDDSDTQFRNVFQTSASDSTSTISAPFRRRSSTIRFGTQEFQDPEIQSKINEILERTLK